MEMIDSFSALDPPPIGDATQNGVVYMLGQEVVEWESMVESMLWFTYRCGFEAMSPYGYCDDAGWGCMLRSCQMLLGNAMLRHLGECRRKEIVRWFADAPGERAIYSIHNMVRVGQRYDMLPGEWYGPGVAAHVLRDLCEAHDAQLRLMVTSAEKPLCREAVLDDMSREAVEIVEEPPPPPPVEGLTEYDPLFRPPPAETHAEHQREARQLARRNRLEGTEWSESLLLLVPIRLGLHKLEDKFVAPLLACLAFPQSVGIVGGRPRQALYFPGRKEDQLVGLDPHVVQPSPGLGPGLHSEKYLDSLVCRSPRLVEAGAIDPSLALAFYCRRKADFCDFLRRAIKLTELSDPPLFDVQEHIARVGPHDIDFDDPDPSSSSCIRCDDDDDDDDYVVV